MSLPKIEYPLFSVEVPSTKKKIKMRPMLVKEEKILLMAKEGKDNNSTILAVKQVVNNCLANADIDINKLTLFDLDYLFVQLRANSVDSKIQMSFTDDDDEEVLIKKTGKTEKKVYNIDVDLFDVKVKFPDKIDQIIKIGKDAGIKLKYPTCETYDSEAIAKAETPEQIIEELIIHSFESYFEGEKVHSFKDSTRAEINEFIDNLNVTTYNKVVEFFENMPTIFYEVKYTNTKGTEKTVTLKKLNDFFIF